MFLTSVLLYHLSLLLFVFLFMNKADLFSHFFPLEFVLELLLEGDVVLKCQQILFFFLN
jgi:hypothetical protein